MAQGETSTEIVPPATKKSKASESQCDASPQRVNLSKEPAMEEPMDATTATNGDNDEIEDKNAEGEEKTEENPSETETMATEEEPAQIKATDRDQEPHGEKLDVNERRSSYHGAHDEKESINVARCVLTSLSINIELLLEKFEYYYIDASKGFVLIGRHPTAYSVWDPKTNNQYRLPRVPFSFKEFTTALIIEDSPVNGAKAKIVCSEMVSYGKNKNEVVIYSNPTDSKGYFHVALTHIKNLSHCRVKLYTSPVETCKNPTNVNKGLTGVLLSMFSDKNLKLFNVGPFYFTGSKPAPATPKY
ncbi:unnamed protein product [Arabidopsis arenosa]|uniref:Uncharacterized protein n=1 Tax=Arabidopsis arenosa TaxID=38785 RepID=A0A8S1ZKE5_ARAAE|nr:unnamed protein product [Arabidopsis arenosa]